MCQFISYLSNLSVNWKEIENSSSQQLNHSEQVHKNSPGIIIKNLLKFLINMEHMKELFYLHEVIAQTLENYPFKLKEKDFSIHKL